MLKTLIKLLLQLNILNNMFQQNYVMHADQRKKAFTRHAKDILSYNK